MRRCLCALLLSCVLSVASLTAAELTTAQAQQLVSAAETAKPGGNEVETTVTINGETVTFKVKRDAVGSAIARPLLGADSKVDIAQVSIQFQVVPNGTLAPTTIVLITIGQTVVSYSVQLNPDRTIANLYQPGGLGGGTGQPQGNKPPTGGINSSNPTVANAGNAPLPVERYPGFTAGQLLPPPGTRTGEGTRQVSPTVP